MIDAFDVCRFTFNKLIISIYKIVIQQPKGPENNDQN